MTNHEFGLRSCFGEGVDPIAVRRIPSDDGGFALVAYDGYEEPSGCFPVPDGGERGPNSCCSRSRPIIQRRGIGQHLLSNSRVRSGRRARRIHLEVRDGNPAAAMYRLAGFEPAGRRPNYYRGTDGRQFDALTFARAL